MEEAIAVLEKRVEIDRALRDGSVESDYDEFCENECLAIEKLIKGYRDGEDILKEAVKENLELKEYIRELERRNDTLEYLNDGLRLDKKELKYKCEEMLNDLTKASENSISKSRIKEKIEKLRKEPLKIKQNDKYYFVTDAYNKIITQVLQELMEDSNETDSQF